MGRNIHTGRGVRKHQVATQPLLKINGGIKEHVRKAPLNQLPELLRKLAQYEYASGHTVRACHRIAERRLTRTQAKPAA